MPKTKPKWPWHVIYGKDLMRLLKRASEGENPGLIYLEEYVNAEKKSYTPDPKPVKKPKKGKK